MQNNQATRRLYLESHFDVPELLVFPEGAAAIYSHRCPGDGRVNEDGALVLPVDDSRLILAVADGCGGATAGAMAARITLETLQQSLVRNAPHTAGSLRAVILDGIETANVRVRKLGVGAATTLAVAEIDGNKVRTFHLGDSQIVLIGNRGKLKIHTPAHSPVGYAIEAGVLSLEDAMSHDQRHIISNYVGADFSHIDVSMPQRMAIRDTLVLASDGVLDNLFLDEVCNMVRTGKLRDVAVSLAQATARRIHGDATQGPCKPDDATFIVYRRRRPTIA